MSLDTKYRPKTYDEVLGQEGTVTSLCEFVKTGRGYRQSYIFGGPWGSGKTTLARIMARALLCDNPQDGAPCDECPSCKTMLSRPDSHESFIEVDAATKSGKADVAKIVSDLQYNTFSGKQKIYLFDECHELSKQAFDALLLPMEDTRPGSEDKKLVCLFCTTEPGKVRPAVKSRCAPTYTIRPCTPEQIGARMAEICDAEGIEYEDEALPLIAEVTECHIRDALKSLEGVSMLGPVTVPSVEKYLQMDANGLVLDVLSHLHNDLPGALKALDEVLERVSPTTAYEKLAAYSMLAYKTKLGVAQVPSYLDRGRLTEIGEALGSLLVECSSRLASRPSRASSTMLQCDLASLHHLATGQVAMVTRTQTPVAIATPAAVPVPAPSPSQPSPALSATAPREVESAPTVAVEPEPQSEQSPGTIEGRVTSDGVYVDPRAQQMRRADRSASRRAATLDALTFAARLDERLLELAEEDGRSTGRHDMGGP